MSQTPRKQNQRKLMQVITRKRKRKERMRKKKKMKGNL